MPKCDFNKVALWHGCSPVNLLHVFRTPFRKNTSGWQLLNDVTDNKTFWRSVKSFFTDKVKSRSNNITLIEKRDTKEMMEEVISNNYDISETF